MEDYKEVYEKYWKSVVEDGNGNLILDQVQRELHDYKIMLEEAPRVYEEVAGLTKPLTRASAVITALNDKYIYKLYALDDLESMAEDGQVSLEDIREYLRT